MSKVFVLQHIHKQEGGVEDVKFIGVYSSLVEAREAVTRLREQPGFIDQPEGFHIDEYSLDHDHWAEGFVTAAAP